MQFPQRNQKNNSFHFLSLQALKNISHCPLCRKKYDPMQATLLEESEEAHLVHIKCQHCQSSIVVLILQQGPVVSSMGVVTDLNKEDIMRLKSNGTIKEDDVLAVHHGLQEQRIIKQLMHN